MERGWGRGQGCVCVCVCVCVRVFVCVRARVHFVPGHVSRTYLQQRLAHDQSSITAC